MFDRVSPEMQKIAIASFLFNRLRTPEDIADVVTFLVSEESRWITGQHIIANRPLSEKDVGTIHELFLRSYLGQRRINFHFSV